MSDETARLYRKKTPAIEARQWLPGDLVRAGEMVGWLLARGASFDHPSGTGETTTLAIGTAAGTMVAEPGWWVTLGEGAWWAYPPDMFEQAYEPAESAAATVSERDRLAELENAIGWNTSCTSCAAVLDSSIREHDRAERAEERLTALDARLPAGAERPVTPELLTALGALYDVAWNQIATLEGDRPGYSLMANDDVNALDEAAAAVEELLFPATSDEEEAASLALPGAEPAADGLTGAAATSESPERENQPQGRSGGAP